MARPEMTIVTAFKGVDRRSEGHLRTERAKLDTPRELINFHVDPNGHLFFPRADQTLIHDFGVDGPIVMMTWCGFGMVVQTTEKVWLIPYGNVGELDAEFPDPPVELVTLPSPNTPIWVNTVDGGMILFGYTTRGGTTPEGGTWKVEYDSGTGNYTTTDISADDPLGGFASISVLYKGRRFIASRGRMVFVSGLNQHTDFSAGTSFEVAGDHGATRFEESIGAIQGMTAWEDVLVIFMRSSVWLLTGSGPDTWNLRQVQTTIGSSAPWSLTRVEEGLLRYHQLRGDPGVYLFAGSQSHKVSGPLDPYFMGYSPNLTRKGNPYSWQSTTWTRRYYLALSADNASDPQIMVYDLNTRQWTVFDGYTEGAIAADQNGLFVSAGSKVYRCNASDLLPRAPGRNGKFTLGWYDQGNTAGRIRFLGVKLAGRIEATGAGTATVTMTARVPESGPEAAATLDLTTETFENAVLPINLRGPAVEIDFVVTANDDVSVIIESVQLVMSRKGEKVSYA